MSVSLNQAAEPVQEHKAAWARPSVPWLLLIAALALNYIPHILAYAENLMELEHYQFFSLAWLGAAYLLWVRREALRPRADVTLPILGWTGVGLGALMLTAAGVLNSAWLAMVSVVPMALGWAWLVGGWGAIKGVGPSLVLFATTLRLPGALDAELIRGLRALAVRLSSHLLDKIGIIHVPWGNVIRVPGGDLLVDEACSGVNSLVSVMAVVLFLGLLLRRRVLHLALLLIGAAGIVILANVMRVSLVTIAYAQWKIDLLHGWKHSALGIALYAVSLALAASLDQLLLLLGSALPSWSRNRDRTNTSGAYAAQSQTRGEPQPSRESPRPGSNPTPWLLDRIRGRWLKALIALFAAIALINPARWVYAIAVPETGVPETSQLVAHAQATLSEESLPAELVGWRRVDFTTQNREPNDPFGRHSAIWKYRLGHREALVSLDYPFDGWHDLTGCYRSIEWSLREKSESRGSTDPQAAPPHATAQLARPDGQFASLRFGFVNDLGRWVEPPAHTGFGLAGREMPWKLITKRPNYQIQVLWTSFVAPSKEDQGQLTQLFEAASHGLRDRLFASGGIAQ